MRLMDEQDMLPHMHDLKAMLRERGKGREAQKEARAEHEERLKDRGK